MYRPAIIVCWITVAALCGQDAKAAHPEWERQTIDGELQIGYGLALGDVDGDGKTDILLADKRQFRWYRNPDWQSFVMVDGLTERDNVCLAARDIDGDGQVEVAVGAQWNPGETSDDAVSGSVHYLVRPDDPTTPWEPIQLHHEPTVHRMRWIRIDDQRHQLIVVPLHGRDNVRGSGEGVRILAYSPPVDPRQEWSTQLVDDTLHLSHNFDIAGNDDNTESLLLAGKEGVRTAIHQRGEWRPARNTTVAPHAAGEVRINQLDGNLVIATIEPMHGTDVAVQIGALDNSNGDNVVHRHVLDRSLKQGHALAVADVLDLGRLQIIAGWREPNAEDKVGIRLYVPRGDDYAEWDTHTVDDNQIACEDLQVADLDKDGRLDVVAAGRATKNLVVYWNRTTAE